MTETPDWRNLPPLDPAENRPVAERLLDERHPSQTLLAHFDRCARSAFLYAKHRGGPPAHALDRGSLFHEAVADLTRELVSRNENAVPPEVAKDRLQEVIKRHLDLQVPAYERDQLRAMIYNWAVGSYVWPERVIGVELDLELELGGWLVRGRVDLVEQPDAWTLDITDYKTQWAMPRSGEDEEWATGGIDQEGNPRFGGDFQTQIYSLLAAFGTTPDGIRLAEGIERFRVFLRFPRYLREEGLAYRDAIIDRRQLTDFRLDVEDQLERLGRAAETGKWQPVPGSHCQRCPAEAECPLPRHLRPESQLASVDSLADLERLAASWFFMQRRATKLKGRIRAAADAAGHEVIRIGDDLALTFRHREREAIRDKEALRVAVEGAVKYGHPFDWASHVAYSQHTEFDKRKISPRKKADDGDAG